jgi:hypothetical protein
MTATKTTNLSLGPSESRLAVKKAVLLLLVNNMISDFVHVL